MKNYELRIKNYTLPAKLLFILCLLCGAGQFVAAQSTNQNAPTPVTSNEISGAIRARDIGDARLTSYFYLFNAAQGDVFINVVTKNLDGDIDVFTAEGLRPLTKIRVYSDNPEGETGRVIYLRQPQRLILRVEGRTPTDDPASFRIKFAGSFQPLTGVAESEDAKMPEVTSAEETDVRVNSVGTIIEVKPKPTPTPKAPIAKVEPDEAKRPAENPETEAEVTRTAKTDEPEERRDDQRPEVIVTENIPEKRDETDAKPEDTVAEKVAPKKTPTTRREVRPRRPTPAKTETKPEKKSEVTAVDPEQLADVRLLVDFKDGRKIEMPMTQILKFGVDKGILTIITKDGSIGRYSMLDISKITVQ